MKYKNLLQAPMQQAQYIVDIKDESQAAMLATLGLTEGALISKVATGGMSAPVWLRGPWGQAIVDGESADGIFVRLDGGQIRSATALQPHQKAYYLGGVPTNDILNKLGIQPEQSIRLMRKLPLMTYVVQGAQKKVVRIDCKSATRIWGLMDGRKMQFAAALVKRLFAVESILGENDSSSRLSALGIRAGVDLTLLRLEQIPDSGQNDPGCITIAKTNHLQIHIPATVAANIFVRSCEACWNCGECLHELALLIPE
jgi:Fe2+ transport system protein FeoA